MARAVQTEINATIRFISEFPVEEEQLDEFRELVMDFFGVEEFAVNIEHEDEGITV